MKTLISFLIQVSFISLAYAQEECSAEFLFMTVQEIPLGLASDGNNFWVSGRDNLGQSTITIHDELGNYLETIKEDTPISGLEIQEDTLWGVEEQFSRLYKMNKLTGETYEEFGLPSMNGADPNNWGIAFDGTNLIVVEYSIGAGKPSSLYTVNPINGEVLDTVAVDLIGLLPVEIKDGVMLGVARDSSKFYEIDLATGAFTYLSDWCLSVPYDIAFNPQGELFGISGLLPDGTQSVYQIDSVGLNTNVFEARDKQEALLYPNPTTGILNIEIPHWNNGTLKIINSLGAVVRIDLFQNGHFEKDISSFAPGIYYIYLENGENQIIKKISKL